MGIQEFITGGGISLCALLTVIQIAPIKVNPWSAIAKASGRAINAEVLNELAEMKKTQKETREKLEAHVEIDDEWMADVHRTRILHFNNELLREIDHTKEEFIEALADIDEYEQYCKDHPKYKNNRAILVITALGGILGLTDLSPLSAIPQWAYGELGIHTAFIIWKAKAENQRKYRYGRNRKTYEDKEVETVQPVEEMEDEDL